MKCFMKFLNSKHQLSHRPLLFTITDVYVYYLKTKVHKSIMNNIIIVILLNVLKVITFEILKINELNNLRIC